MSQVKPIAAVEEYARAFVVRMHGRWSPADAEGVVVGYNDSQSIYEARAFTDSGTTRENSLTVTNDQILFEDRVPGHGVTADRARKVLSPRPTGFDEALEVQAGSEAFRPYSILELRPVRAAALGDVP